MRVLHNNNIIHTLKSISILILLTLTNNAVAAGLLTPANGQLPTLEIKKHNVDVIIEDGYAITKVEQIFHNPHNQDLEAIYSFPVPEQGAVAEFTVWIDGKPVTGEVLEKQQARNIYESEKQAGRDTGLTEKDEYKTFDISVSPVLAGQDTRIRFVYMQSAHVDTGIGRYVYPLEEGGVDEEKLSFWTANEKVKEEFSFNIQLKSAYPVEALRLPNQPQAIIKTTSLGEWQATLFAVENNAALEGTNTQAMKNKTVYTLDHDIVVYWRHQSGLPGSIDMVTYKPDSNKKGTFMITVTPGDDLKTITEGSDWVFVLDTSGSMKGKYTTLADGVQRALTKMRVNDRFRIVLFNSSSNELTNGYVNATIENINYYSQELLKITPNHGTDLYSGLKKGLRSIDADRTSSIILVTDGVANVGERAQRKFIDLLQKKDIRLFTFIMGNSANRPLLDTLTKTSNGFSAGISNSDDIVGKILEATNKVTHESLHGVELTIDGVKTADLSPTVLGSLYHGQQLIVFGHYWGEGIADIRMNGKISGSKKEYRSQINFPSTSNANPELERLWAFSSIEGMMEQINNYGEDADIKQAVTDIGIEYGLVTDYTSMLVVRDEVFDSLGIKRNNKQRLEKERDAQQTRTKQAPSSHRVDKNQPMFNTSRPSYGSGGGALNVWILLLLIPVVYLTRNQNNI